jgi:hypothetical protein
MVNFGFRIAHGGNEYNTDCPRGFGTLRIKAYRILLYSSPSS